MKPLAHSPAVVPRKPLHSEILRTLVYYDLWHHPLTAVELYTFLPVDSMTMEEFCANIDTFGPGTHVTRHQGYYSLQANHADAVATRITKQNHARRLWKRARVSMHIIKRFPFVRAVFVSGDLSKNAATEESDVDFVIITEPNRLWISRALLILFKKVFLLNKKKFFCLNLFVSYDHLQLDEQNIFLATEIAHLKPLYNSDLFRLYLDANSWIKAFFPNYRPEALQSPTPNNRRSILQKLLELPFEILPTDRFDDFLLQKMQKVWERRYPEYDAPTRDRIFRCTKHESRAYVGNFEGKVLQQYEQRLKDFGVLS